MSSSDNPAFTGAATAASLNAAGFSIPTPVGNPIDHPTLSLINTQRASRGLAAAGVPSAPAAPVATGGNAQASVAFVAPASVGFPITGYTVTSTPGSITATGTATPIVVTGLTNATPYTFTITATNAAGVSAASAASNSVTPSA